MVDGRDRKRLERLCRYVARPPLNQERLELHGDGRVRLAFKAAWKDGTHAVLLDPLDFIARLCALVPPPRFHMVRYHGVFAAHSSARAEVVLGREPEPPPQLPLFAPADLAPLAPPAPRASRHPWAWLLRRVFAVDVTTCPVPGCGGRMRLVEIAKDPDDIARVLASEGLLRARDPHDAPLLHLVQGSCAFSSAELPLPRRTAPSSGGLMARLTTTTRGFRGGVRLRRALAVVANQAHGASRAAS